MEDEEVLSFEEEWLSSPEALEEFIGSTCVQKKNELQQQLHANDSTVQHLHIFHKPRGMKGNWIKIEEYEKIRVSKKSGKKFKLKIALNHIEFVQESLKVDLYEKTANGSSVVSSVEIESVRVVENYLEIDCKIFLPGKNLFFFVQLKSKNGQSHQFHSVEFITHNSGGKDTTNPNVDAGKKRKTEDTPSNESAPNIIPGETETFIPGSIEVNGFVKARAFIQYSDLRLKTEIEDILDAISIVTQLQGKTYQWKKDQDPSQEKNRGRRVIGLIAQEVQKVLPEIVYEDPQTGYLAVNYVEILPILIEAFKEFVSNYEENKEEMRAEITTIKERLQEISDHYDSESMKTLNQLALSSRIIFLTPTKPKEKKGWKKFVPSFHPELHFSLLLLFLVSLLLLCIGIFLLADNSNDESKNFNNTESSIKAFLYGLINPKFERQANPPKPTKPTKPTKPPKPTKPITPTQETKEPTTNPPSNLSQSSDSVDSAGITLVVSGIAGMCASVLGWLYLLHCQRLYEKQELSRASIVTLSQLEDWSFDNYPEGDDSFPTINTSQETSDDV